MSRMKSNRVEITPDLLAAGQIREPLKYHLSNVFFKFMDLTLPATITAVGYKVDGTAVAQDAKIEGEEAVITLNGLNVKDVVVWVAKSV